MISGDCLGCLWGAEVHEFVGEGVGGYGWDSPGFKAQAVGNTIKERNKQVVWVCREQFWPC